MPAKYTIDKTQGLVLSTCWDVVSSRELKDQIKRLLRDRDFNPHYRQFLDLTDVISFSASFQEMLAVAQLNVFALDTRRAILAPSNATFGIARMFQMMREAKGETRLRVFRDRTEAVHWLETGATEPARKKK